VRDGRIQFLSQFPELAQPGMRSRAIDPGDPATFERSKLDSVERRTHARIYQLHKDLLRLRRDDGVIPGQRARSVDGAVLAGEAFLLRYFSEGGDDRLLLVNLGPDLLLQPMAEPLLAPPEDRVWDLIWSSEDPAYGGGGTAPVCRPDGWWLPGHAAVVMRPAPK
jgi:maltooligosyltrehalose trehalohydrolase